MKEGVELAGESSARKHVGYTGHRRRIRIEEPDDLEQPFAL
jgi:hypothetical protein